MFNMLLMCFWPSIVVRRSYGPEEHSWVVWDDVLDLSIALIRIVPEAVVAPLAA